MNLYDMFNPHPDEDEGFEELNMMEAWEDENPVPDSEYYLDDDDDYDYEDY